MIIKDNYLHGLTIKDGTKVSFIKTNIIGFVGLPNGTRIVLQDCPTTYEITMPYEEVQVTLQEKVC